MKRAVEFTTVHEATNVYRLEDGTLVKVKVIVGKITVDIDEHGNHVRTPGGEPLINIASNTMIVAVPPEEQEPAAATQAAMPATRGPVH